MRIATISNYDSTPHPHPPKKKYNNKNTFDSKNTRMSRSIGQQGGSDDKTLYPAEK